MDTYEAIKLLMEQDIRADFGEIHNHESVAEHLAERIDTLWNENEKLKARNEKLEAALLRANATTEEYERKFYLGNDRIEALEAALRYYAKEYENPFGDDDSLIARKALGEK